MVQMPAMSRLVRLILCYFLLKISLECENLPPISFKYRESLALVRTVFGNLTDGEVDFSAVVNDETNTVRFDYEKIPKLCNKMFNFTYPLSSISIYECSIQEIEQDIFKDVDISNELSINRNNISVLRRHTFRNLKMMKLILGYNSIRVIEPEAISDLPRLGLLDLSGNNLTVLDPKAFNNLPKLDNLNVNYNYLKKLGGNFFHFMTSNGFLTITLYRNQIEAVDGDVLQGLRCSNIFLRLAGNHLKKFPVKPLLYKNCSLTLDLEENDIQAFDEEFYTERSYGNVTLILQSNPLTKNTRSRLKLWSKQHKIGVIFGDSSGPNLTVNYLLYFVIVVHLFA